MTCALQISFRRIKKKRMQSFSPSGVLGWEYESDEVHIFDKSKFKFVCSHAIEPRIKLCGQDSFNKTIREAMSKYELWR